MRTAFRSASATWPLLAALAAAGCAAPDPKQHLELVSHEFYWVIESSAASTTFIAPAARLEIRNPRDEESLAVQASATFRRVAPEDAGATWGSAFAQVAGGENRMAPGETRTVLLQSDARYYSTGSPREFFEHELFRDATVEVFLRVGSSQWVPFVAGEIPRQIGSQSVVLGAP